MSSVRIQPAQQMQVGAVLWALWCLMSGMFIEPCECWV